MLKLGPTVPVSRFGAGGGVVTGGVPTVNCPRIVVECGSQTKR